MFLKIVKANFFGLDKSNIRQIYRGGTGDDSNQKMFWYLNLFVDTWFVVFRASITRGVDSTT